MSALEQSLSVIEPHDLSVVNAKLPIVYESAKLALSECSRIDECKDWANKAEALASYARQADDDTLRNMAIRIQARAIRRCGELLNAIEAAKGGDRGNGATGGRTPIAQTRTSAAQEAGLSEWQQKTAVRVANVPAEQFEAVIESEKPPTVTKLAEIGTKTQPKPLIDLNGRNPQEFALSTKGQGAIGRLFEITTQIEPAVVARGAFQNEKEGLKKQASQIIKWMQNLEKELMKHDGN